MKYTKKEWLAELENRFGKDQKNWAFVCPACGKISTVKEFNDVGANVNNAFQECIGRYTGKEAPTKENKGGCNWAAYGLFGTLTGGDIVTAEDGNGKGFSVFYMATAKDIKGDK